MSDSPQGGAALSSITTERELLLVDSPPPAPAEALRASADPFFFIDRQHRAWPMNLAAQGLAPGSVGRGPVSCHRLFHGEDSPCTGPGIPCPLRRVLVTRKSCRIEHEHLVPGGRRSAHEIAAAPFVENGRLEGIVVSLRDTSLRKRLERRLLQREAYFRHLATHDSLTGLLNRSSFFDRLEHAVSLARRADRRLAIAFLDLDDFKGVNDRLGHETGDALLAQFSQRLRSSLRNSDTLARLGGDEFAFLLEEVRDAANALRVAQKLLRSLRGEYRLANQRSSVEVSVGLALFPDHGVDRQTLLRQADRAMYRAKQHQGSRVELA